MPQNHLTLTAAISSNHSPAAGAPCSLQFDSILYMYILVDTSGVHMSKPATLTVQRWGNSLAVRIPAAVAKSARFKVGQPVEVSAQDSYVLVKPVGDPKLNLAQK